MSDISKKIFSIEPDTNDIIKNIDPIENAQKTSKDTLKRIDEPMPDFIKRERVTSPVDAALLSGPETGWIMWSGILLSILWIAGVSIYFFFVLKIQATSDIGALTAFILIAFLPVIFLNALWMAWRRLIEMSYQAQNIGIIAQNLIRADETAMENTKRLADGIRQEIDAVDTRLADTIDRFGTLRVNLSSEKRAIDETALALTERSEDVGRNLTLQRQALESISGTFDSKMEILSSNIEKQSQALNLVTEKAQSQIVESSETLKATAQTVIEALSANLETQNEKLTQATSQTEKHIQGASEMLEKQTLALTDLGDSLKTHISNADMTLSGSSENLEQIQTNLSKLIARLQEEQSKLQSEMNTQIKDIADVTDNAQESTSRLIETLNLGQKSVSALNQASITTNDTLKQQFTDMGDKIAEAQLKANEISEKAAARVQESLSDTRRDLAKLETDMLALQAKLRNAKAESENLDLDLKTPTAPQDQAVGRLRLKPLDTDFPPVEPPRILSERESVETALTPELFEPLAEVPQPQQPLNLGADMRLASDDDPLTSFDPDILRRPAPEEKSFGRANPKQKSGWKWRDMLGGLERPTEEVAADIVTPPSMVSRQTGPLQPPAEIDSSEIVAALCKMDLAPSAIIDEGTIIEASNIYSQYGPEAMHTHIATRLASPVAHLQQNLSQNPALADRFGRFTNAFAGKINRLPRDSAHLRAEFGSAQGRAFLICAGLFQI